MSFKKHSHILIMVPTYNEITNVPSLIEQLIEIRPKIGNADIMFIDDNSPDGTGKWLDDYAEKYNFISVIHRDKKEGIGTAHLYGIQLAYSMGYTHLVTMDADFTHPPEFIPKLLEKSGDYDIVIGGRHSQTVDSLVGWTWWRKLLTYTDHQFTVILLHLPYDSTSAFRVYRLDTIPSEIFNLAKSKSYSFFFEILCILNENKFTIYDVPVVLPPRSAGKSKLKYMDIVDWIFVALKLGVKIRTHTKDIYLKS
jgi:dolichol-phosphate mannosyltransferase